MFKATEDVVLIIAGSCSAFAVIISGLLIRRHLIHFSRPVVQVRLGRRVVHNCYSSTLNFHFCSENVLRDTTASRQWLATARVQADAKTGRSVEHCLFDVSWLCVLVRLKHPRSHHPGSQRYTRCKMAGWHQSGIWLRILLTISRCISKPW